MACAARPAADNGDGDSEKTDGKQATETVSVDRPKKRKRKAKSGVLAPVRNGTGTVALQAPLRTVTQWCWHQHYCSWPSEKQARGPYATHTAQRAHVQGVRDLNWWRRLPGRPRGCQVGTRGSHGARCKKAAGEWLTPANEFPTPQLCVTFSGRTNRAWLQAA